MKQTRSAAVFGAMVLLWTANRAAMAADECGELCRNMTPEAVQQFEKAWKLSHAGTVDVEVVVLVSRARNGKYSAEVQPMTNQHHRLAFRFHPGVVAVFHTHPNRVGEKPSRMDRKLADRLVAPIATITNRGLYVYWPKSGRTTRLMKGVEWLDPENWGGPSDEIRATVQGDGPPVEPHAELKRGGR